MSTFKLLYHGTGGERGRIPDLAIVNIGGTIGPTFTVGGRPLMFADGTSTGPGGTSPISTNFQSIYNASTPATINLSAGNPFTITALNNNSFFIDPVTGKVTITGDLEVLGSSTVIEGTLANVDQVSISPPNGTTSALLIQPLPGVVPTVNLVNIQRVHGGQSVFSIDSFGNTRLKQLTIDGLLNGINFTQFYQDFVQHVTSSASLKHQAAEISVAGPFVNIGPATTVQAAITQLDALVGTGSTPSTGRDSGLFFTDASPTSTGIVGAKTYVAGTTPVNRVINQATTDTGNVTVALLVESDRSFYSPVVTVTTVPAQTAGAIIATLIEDPSDRRTFSAVATLTNITANTLVNAVSSTGATATMTIVAAALGPTFGTLVHGAYPGTQTAVKVGDTLSVSGTVRNSAAFAELLAGGAAASTTFLTLGAADSAGLGFKTVTGTYTVSNAVGVQTVSARARNTLGTFGTTIVSDERILDQTFPTIGARTITYTLGRQALNTAIDTATIASAVTNFDSVVYSSGPGTLFVGNPAVYGSKTVNPTGLSTYSFGTNNFTITATRNANAAVSTASSAVSIATVPAQASISIAGNPPRLTSSAVGNNFTITLVANQQLQSPPSLLASSGTWQGAWVGSGTTWSRVLRIVDMDPKGSQLFSNLSVTGLGGLVGSTITSGAAYVVGGFSARNIIFPAFTRYAPIGTSVTDVTKLVVSYTGSTVLTYHPDTGQHFQGFTITDSGPAFTPTGDHLFISDLAFSGANTTGTLSLTIQELA